MIPLLLLGANSCSSADETTPGPTTPSPDTYVPGSTAGIDGDIRIEIASGEASEFQLDENIEKSWDGDMSTLYHSPWSGPANFPVTLEYRFENPENVDYIVYKPARMPKTDCSESSNSLSPPKPSLNSSNWATTISK